MRALLIKGGGKIAIEEVPLPSLRNKEVLVKMKAAALNRRDWWIIQGKYPGIREDAILGADGAGIVEEVFDDSLSHWLGKPVIINPNIGWGDDPKVQSSAYKILGMPTNGTFSALVAIAADRLVAKPDHLSFAEAAALPLAGLTAYRAVFHHGKVKHGENVLISGFGGGVAQFAFQFAKEAGANVYVTSGQDKKLEGSMSLGAKAGFNYNTAKWEKQAMEASGGFHLIIDSAGSDQLNTFIKIMKPAGRLVFFGATLGLPSNLDLHRIFWNQLTLQGSTMGNDEEFVRMVAFVNQHKLKPLLAAVLNFSEIEQAFEMIAGEEKLGKIVVEFDE